MSLKNTDRLVFWIVIIFVLLISYLASGCTQIYIGTISEYDGEGQLVAQWKIESNQPMMLEAGKIKGDSRTKPLFESLGMDLGFYKYKGTPGGWYEY